MPVDKAWLERLLQRIHESAEKNENVDILIMFNRRDPQGNKKPPQIRVTEFGG